MNGSVRLVYWILGGLLSVVVLMASAWATNTHQRLVEVEQKQEERMQITYELRNQVELLKQEIRGLRCDYCRQNEKFDDYRERHGERPWRTPCGTCQ